MGLKGRLELVAWSVVRTQLSACLSVVSNVFKKINERIYLWSGPHITRNAGLFYSTLRFIELRKTVIWTFVENSSRFVVVVAVCFCFVKVYWSTFAMSTEYLRYPSQFGRVLAEPVTEALVRSPASRDFFLFLFLL